MKQAHVFAALGAINAALAIAAGAFGAHALRERLNPRQLEVFEVGARYHMYSALGLIALGLLVGAGMLRATWPGWALQAGALVFSGSLYALALTDVKVLGAITPIGGAAMLVAWIAVAVQLLRA